MKLIWIITSILMLMSNSSFSTEVDNFTDSDVPLQDSRKILNDKMDKMIAQSISRANQKYNCEISPRSSKERFYKQLNSRIGGFLWAKYENQVVKDSSIDKRYLSRKNSIYKDLSFSNGFAFYLAKLGAVVNIGDNYVGTDKLGHFIGIGKVYFDKMRKKGMTLGQVMLYGQNSEHTIFGLITTGVMSYGDLVSNYEGLRFWHSFFGSNNKRIKCSDGKLSIIRKFDWLEYVTDAWDESLNCSVYRNSLVESRVLTQVKSTKSLQSSCPISNLSPETIYRYAKTPLKVLNI